MKITVKSHRERFVWLNAKNKKNRGQQFMADSLRIAA